MWILNICLGMYMNVCGQVYMFEYNTQQECKAAQQVAQQVVIRKHGYAVCYPDYLIIE